MSAGTIIAALVSGGSLELPVTAERPAHFPPGQRGTLKHQGTRLVEFSVAGTNAPPGP